MHDLFPDAPVWLPWLAVVLDSLLALLFFLAISPSPIEAWSDRKERRDAGRAFEKELIRFRGIESDLLNAPLRQGVTQELRRVGKDG